MTGNGALFSDCDCYRYRLWRIRDAAKGLVTFIALNPATADEVRDDQTSRKCAEYARAWAFGGVIICNLFAWRSKDPRSLRRCVDPIGPDNDRHIWQCVALADLTVVAWGEYGPFCNRAAEVLRMVPAPYSLRVNDSGQPAHPTRLPYNLEPRPYGH